MLRTSIVTVGQIIRNSNHTRLVVAAASQRFGHYGIRSLILIYLISEFKMSDQHAGQTYGFFYGSIFLTSLAGGVLGDTRLGHRGAGAIGLIFMLAAQVSLAVGQVAGTFAGLVLYSLGFGLFNPNMYVAVGEQFQNDENLRSAAYTILYSGINLGAMLGPLVCGYVAVHTSWRYGFLAGIPFTLLALISFASNASVRDGASSVKRSQVGDNKQEERPVVRRKRLVPMLIGLGIIAVIFAGVFDQLGSSVTLLVYRHTQRTFSNFQIPAGYVQSINPFLVIVIGPVLSLMIKRGAFSSTRAGKIKILILGSLLLGSGFLLLSVGSIGLADTGARANVGWVYILSAILFATLGELLFSPTSISLVSGLSPQKFKGLVMGIWSATVGVGLYLSGAISGAIGSPENFSAFFALSAAGCLLACLFLLLAIRELRGM